MNMRTIVGSALALAAMSYFSAATAAPMPCNTGWVSAEGASEVTASHCTGVFEGNTPNSSVTINGTTLNFLGKYDLPGKDPAEVTGSIPGLFAALDGTWSFNADLTFTGTWAIALKAANCYAAFSFGAGTFSGGTYSIPWDPKCEEGTPNPGLSHISVFGQEPTQVPEPHTLALLGLGLVGFAIARRRKATV